MVELVREALHASVTDPVAASMNFLNEVAGRFPDAISLAAGRPYDEFYEVDDVERYLPVYIGHLRDAGMRRGADPPAPSCSTAGPTARSTTLIARMLDIDEDIHVPAEAIMVTVGLPGGDGHRAARAVRRPATTWCSPPSRATSASPARPGCSASPWSPVPETAQGLDPETVAAGRPRGAGQRSPPARALRGAELRQPVRRLAERPRRRRGLLEVAAEQDLLILEDDPYGLFGLDDRPRPDAEVAGHRPPGHLPRLVRQVGASPAPGSASWSPTRPWSAPPATARLLADELSTVKSMVTVNTSPIAQAVIGGVLASCGLQPARGEPGEDRVLPAQPPRAAGRAGAALRRSARSRWNSPSGGFFAVLDVPVRADEKLLEISARDYGVLWTPMSFFYLDGGGSHAIRLSCSALTPGPDRRGRPPPGGADRRRPVVTDLVRVWIVPGRRASRRPRPAVGTCSTTSERARADAFLQPARAATVHGRARRAADPGRPRAERAARGAHLDPRPARQTRARAPVVRAAHQPLALGRHDRGGRQHRSPGGCRHPAAGARPGPDRDVRPVLSAR